VAPVVRLQGVEKTYRSGLRALQGIDLSVAPGEFVSLLGPSGCGKSTLLRIAAGLSQPTRGGVSWDLPADRRGQIGFAFQEPTLLPWATVEANVGLPLRLSRAAGAASRVHQAIARVGLAGFEGAYPRELSGGMRMRVSIARALVTGPRLLLLDEPFAALDEITRFRLNDDLLRLFAEQRFAVLFVTHSVFESVFLSQRVLVMSPRPGRIAAELSVPLDHPRRPELRTRPEYAELCRRASAALQEAMVA
jgi:NitT/TauT family transport system ATP-binding protein